MTFNNSAGLSSIYTLAREQSKFSVLLQCWKLKKQAQTKTPHSPAMVRPETAQELLCTNKDTENHLDRRLSSCPDELKITILQLLSGKSLAPGIHQSGIPSACKPVS